MADMIGAVDELALSWKPSPLKVIGDCVVDALGESRLQSGIGRRLRQGVERRHVGPTKCTLLVRRLRSLSERDRAE
jgi:hypothetical protein